MENEAIKYVILPLSMHFIPLFIYVIYKFMSFIYKLFCLCRLYDKREIERGEREKGEREKGETILFIYIQEECSYKHRLQSRTVLL